jgi:hypothetical protein
MVELPDERQLVLEARSQLEQWTKHARREAYADLFDGDDPLLTPEEVQRLDAIDSELERQGGDGVWGTDQYGIHTAGTSSSDTPLVVCVYHPQITEDSVLRGGDDIDDDTEERLNAALWAYGERVATLIEAKLDAFVGRD